jgi:hypothetical protein
VVVCGAVAAPLLLLLLLMPPLRLCGKLDNVDLIDDEPTFGDSVSVTVLAQFDDVAVVDARNGVDINVLVAESVAPLLVSEIVELV